MYVKHYSQGLSNKRRPFLRLCIPMDVANHFKLIDVYRYIVDIQYLTFEEMTSFPPAATERVFKVEMKLDCIVSGISFLI